MKESPSDHELLINLKPSRFSGEGFLGTDTRPLREIISDDLRLLDRLGISIETLAESLRAAYRSAEKALGAPVQLREGVTALYHESMGKIPSPFRGEGVFPKGEVVITGSGERGSIVLTPLSIHLIEKHGFFQGRGSYFRIDPRLATELLGLAG